MLVTLQVSYNEGDCRVCTNLWPCPKGPASEWWLSELGETEKRFAKLGNKLFPMEMELAAHLIRISILKPNLI